MKKKRYLLFWSVHLSFDCCSCKVSSFSGRSFIHIFVPNIIHFQGVLLFIIVFYINVAQFGVPSSGFMYKLKRRCSKTSVFSSIKRRKGCKMVFLEKTEKCKGEIELA